MAHYNGQFGYHQNYQQYPPHSSQQQQPQPQPQRPMYQSSSSSQGRYHPTSPVSPPITLQPGQLVRPNGHMSAQQHYPPAPAHTMRPASIHSAHSYDGAHSHPPAGRLDQPLPNPHVAGYQYSSPPRPQPRPSSHDDTADYQAALEASRSSAAAEALKREQAEAEETHRLQLAHEQDQREQRARQEKEEEELQRVMIQSRLAEETRQRRVQEEEERVIEESRKEAQRLKQEEEEMQNIMKQSLQEEWQRRKEAEMEEIRLVEIARKEIEQQQQSASGSSRGPGTIQGSLQSDQHQRQQQQQQLQQHLKPEQSEPHQQSDPHFQHQQPQHSSASTSATAAGRRPLPRVPGAAEPEHHTAHIEDPDPDSDSAPVADPSTPPPSHDPFTDQAEAPPDYDSVHSDRPPDAPSRAPTGFWPQRQPTRQHESDPIEEKRRMERAGAAVSSAPEQNQTFHVVNPSASTMPTREHTPRPGATGRQGGSAASGSGADEYVDSNDGSSAQHSTPHTPSDSLHSAPWTGSDSTPPTSYTNHRDESDSGEQDCDGTHPGMMLGRTPSSATAASASSQSQSQSQARPAPLGQSTPLGIDWGYSDEAFATELRPGPRHNYRGGMSAGKRSRVSSSTPSSPFVIEDGENDIPDEEDESTESMGKDRFPHVVTLLQEAWKQDSSADPSEAAGPYFTIRCGSWRLLLRTLAWLGNTQVEAGPNEVVDAANENRPCTLKTEVEFVTPSIASTKRVSTSSLLAPEHYGGDQGKLTLEEIVRRAQVDGQEEGNRNVLTACVSVCISLFNSSSKTPSSAIKDLDISYLHSGSTRRVLNLPPSSMGLSPIHPQSRHKSGKGNTGFILPCNLIDLANNLVTAHKFSASCPTSGSTARHTPRDLYHTIANHDENFIKRLRKELHNGGHRVRMSKMMFSHISSHSILLWDPNPPSATNSSHLTSPTDISSKDDNDDDDDMDEIGQEVSDLHLHQRMKNRIKKKWRGRQGNVEDGTEVALRNWITPFDVSDVG
ncbi:unnamed protein product [Sympodiomycopsis kandeliae]